MAYGIEISSAIGSEDITDLTSFRLLAAEIKTETITTQGQVFTYTAPSGWTTSNGTFYVAPNSSGVLPSFYTSGTNTIKAESPNSNYLVAATSWEILWLLKTGSDTPSGYGLLVANGSGQTVLSNDTETMLAASSGTLTSYTTTNTGMRQFSLPSGFSLLDDTVFVKLNDGHNFYATSRNVFATADNPKLNTTTATTLDYFIVSRSKAIPAPTGGYGLAVFSGDGTVVYRSDYDIFPSNGKTLRLDGSNTAVVDGTKDLWVSLNFGCPAPFCPSVDGQDPTYNFITGIKRIGNVASFSGGNMLFGAPSRYVSTAHDNTALLVQR